MVWNGDGDEDEDDGRSSERKWRSGKELYRPVVRPSREREKKNCLKSEGGIRIEAKISLLKSL